MMEISMAMLASEFTMDNQCLAIHDNTDRFFGYARLAETVDGPLDENILYISYNEKSLLEIEAFKSFERKDLAFLFFEKPDDLEKYNCCGWVNSKIQNDTLNNSEQNKTTQSSELRTLLRFLDEVLNVFQIYSVFEKKLQDTLYKPKPLQTSLELLCEKVRNPGYIVNTNFRGVAVYSNSDLPNMSINWKNLYEQGYLSHKVVTSILSNPEWRIISSEKKARIVKTDEFATRFITKNFFKGNSLKWQLFITELEHGITQAEVDLVQACSQHFYSILSSDEHFLAVDSDKMTTFFRESLLGKVKDIGYIEGQISTFGWAENQFYSVVEMEFVPHRDSTNYLEVWCSSRNWVRMVSLGERTTLIINNSLMSDFEELNRELEGLFEKVEGCGAVSDIFRGFHKTDLCNKQAEMTLDYLNRTNNKKDRLSFYTSFATTIFSNELSKTQKELFIPDSLNDVKEYDRIHGTSYLETLRVYLLNNQNLVETAKALFIHRNTLVYRLSRLQIILNADLNDKELAFRLLCGCEFERMR